MRRAELMRAAGLSLGPAIALGLARFAYALLLPAMRANLGWSYIAAAGLTTATAAGYLLGAMLAAPLSDRLGGFRSFTGGLAVTALALLASGLTRQYVMLLCLRALAGVAGAVSFVVGAALAADGDGEARGGGASGLALAIYFGGAGLGIMGSSLLIALLPHLAGGSSWPLGWEELGIAALVGTVGAAAAARRGPGPVAGRRLAQAWHPFRLAPTLIAYAAFGAGYIVYMTFIVAFLQQEALSPDALLWFWTVLGAAAMGLTYGWGALLSRLPGRWGPALVLCAVSLGAALPLVSRAPDAVFGSAVVFGGSFLAMPTAATATARRMVPRAAWTAAIGLLTTLFAVGQMLGPLAAGAIADTPSGIRAGLALAMLLLLSAAAISLAQRD